MDKCGTSGGDLGGRKYYIPTLDGIGVGVLFAKNDRFNVRFYRFMST